MKSQQKQQCKLISYYFDSFYTKFQNYIQQNILKPAMTTKELNEFRKKNIEKIRKQNREEIFSKSRSLESQPPVVAIIPSIVEESDYQYFEEILDSIQTEDLQLVNDKYKDFIMDKWKKQQDPIINFQLFRLINRLKIPYQTWLEECIQKLQNWKQLHKNKGEIFNLHTFLKQLAYYFEDETKRKTITQQQKQKLLTAILRSDIQYSVDSLVYLSDIFLKLQFENLSQNDQIFTVIQRSLKQSQNEFLIVRILEILTTKIDLAKCGYKLINLQNFSKLLEIVQNPKSSIDFIIFVLDILSTLISAEQATVIELIDKYPTTMTILQKFQNHILDIIRVKIFWSYSNIAASQKIYYKIKANKIVQLCQLINKETKVKVKMEIIFTILNWICNANEEEIKEVADNFKQFYHFMCSFVKQPESIFLSRALYAIYNIISRIQISRIQFQKEGLVGQLETAYQRQKNQEELSAIQYLLEALKNDPDNPKNQQLQ